MHPTREIVLTFTALVALDASDIPRLGAFLATVAPFIAIAALHATLIGAVALAVALFPVKMLARGNSVLTRTRTRN